MGPLSVHNGTWLPVDPTDRATNRDLTLNGEKDRRQRLTQQRRRKQRDENPDGDEFQHRPDEQPES